ncbi:MAG TPA: hypothetical protein VEF76_09840 [Patescibacteria group bacterium]|nr:hypothetical protein [Patescibacteria group bacterium]
MVTQPDDDYPGFGRKEPEYPPPPVRRVTPWFKRPKAVAKSSGEFLITALLVFYAVCTYFEKFPYNCHNRYACAPQGAWVIFAALAAGQFTWSVLRRRNKK